MLFHPFVLAGDLTVRLSLDLLDKVRNPPAPGSSGLGVGGLLSSGAAGGAAGVGAPGAVGADDAEEDEVAAASAPRRISSRTPRNKQKTQSEINSKSDA